MNAVRAPAVAGLFYPREAQALAREVRDLLDQAQGDSLSPGFPKIVVAPHAGYVYSGPVAAPAYDLLRPARGIVRRVVLLGPCHRVPVRGMALPGARAFDTPFGRVPVDENALAQVRAMPRVADMPEAHEYEHALEVQLPFLQAVLGEFSLLPLVVGTMRTEEVARVLDLVWGGDETLIVISSDLSHYLPYEDARAIDGATARSILGFDPCIGHEQACGATPLSGALLAAKERGFEARMLDLRNSGDTAGGKSRVVGYGSFALGPPGARYEEAHGCRLLALARQAVCGTIDTQAAASGDVPWLRELRASFVSVKVDGALRGCVGTLEAHRPLVDDVAANARGAATMDARFAPLREREHDRMELEVSVLSRPRRIAFEEHGELISQLVPGEDGLLLEHGEGEKMRRSTFLPQVWESLPDPEQFIQELKRKAGLAPETRTTACAVKRYRVLKWRDSELKGRA
jgi:AmmeMemoRadiSam system protein B/AmmeMemoRadiSam system protein A